MSYETRYAAKMATSRKNYNESERAKEVHKLGIVAAKMAKEDLYKKFPGGIKPGMSHNQIVEILDYQQERIEQRSKELGI